MYAERGLFSAQVNWSEPVATDNSGVPPSVTSNYKPLQRFDQGTYMVIYTAMDQSANNATCSLTIVVTGNEMFQGLSSSYPSSSSLSSSSSLLLLLVNFSILTLAQTMFLHHAVKSTRRIDRLDQKNDFTQAKQKTIFFKIKIEL